MNHVVLVVVYVGKHKNCAITIVDRNPNILRLNALTCHLLRLRLRTVPGEQREERLTVSRCKEAGGEEEEEDEDDDPST